MILERRAFERKLNEKIQKNPQFSLTFSHLAPATTYVLAVKFPVVCEQLLEHPLSELLTHTLPSSSTFPEITEILSPGEALGYARFENKMCLQIHPRQQLQYHFISPADFLLLLPSG